MSHDVVRLTPEALGRAREIAVEMASTDLVIRPVLRDAGTFASFAEFQQWHRMHWQHSYRFEQYWQQRLFRIAYREAARNGIADTLQSSHWYVWHSDIIKPLTATMWDAWEEQLELERHYVEALLRETALRRGRRGAEVGQEEQGECSLRIRPEDQAAWLRPEA